MAGVTTSMALVLAAFFAMNIGASGTAASMGVPYGGGAIRNRWIALAFAALFACLGATTGGRAVAMTIGNDLVEPGTIDDMLVLIVLGSACTTLFVANLLGIPLSTSEVTVGAVVGVGLALGGVQFGRLLTVVGAWVLLPALAFAIVGIAQVTLVRWAGMRLAARRKKGPIRRVISVLLVVSGCYEAFAAGMNNVANAVGPLIGARVVDPDIAIPLGGLALAIGAVSLGGRVLETNAKRITRLSLLDATLVSIVGGSLVIVASIAGIPVPLTQIATVGIMSVGWAKRGHRGIDTRVAGRIVRVWLFSPLASVFLSMGAASAIRDASSWSALGTAFVWVAVSLALLMFQAQRRAHEARPGRAS